MQHPVVIIGAGPIGLAAAANAAERGMDFVVLEAGPRRRRRRRRVGARAAVLRAGASSSTPPPAASSTPPAPGPHPTRTPTRPAASGARPTSSRWPISSTRSPAATVRYGTRVVGVSRAGRDLLVDSGREADPFAVHVAGPRPGTSGCWRSAVVDASGTWTRPNPLGADGYPALGERENADRITYGIPDFTDPAVAARYAGKHVAVAGKGASAQGVLIGLATLAEQDHGNAGLLAAAPAERGRRVRRRRQRPARAARQARPAGQGRRNQRPGHQRDPVPHRVRHRPGRRAAHPGLGQRPAGHRRRRGHRRHRLPPRLRLPLRGPPRPRPGPRRRRASSPSRSTRPSLLWRRRPARLQGAGAARAGPLPGRHEVLRPRAVVPGDDRLRAGPLRGRRRSPATWRPPNESSWCCPRPGCATAPARSTTARRRRRQSATAAEPPSPPARQLVSLGSPSQ